MIASDRYLAPSHKISNLYEKKMWLVNSVWTDGQTDRRMKTEGPSISSSVVSGYVFCQSEYPQSNNKNINNNFNNPTTN